VIISTKGIVIRTLKYRETSKILEVFTESNGVVSLIAKGVRKQPKLLGIFEPLNVVFVSYYKRKTQELHLLSKMETISTYHQFLKSQDRLFAGLLILELIRETQPIENPNKYLFDLTINCLEYIKSSETSPFITVIYFIVKLSQDLGVDIIEKLNKIHTEEYNFVAFDTFTGELRINVETEKFPKISKGTVKLLQVINTMSIEELNKIRLLSINFKELMFFIEHYFAFHLDKPIKVKTLDLIPYDI